MSSSFRDRLAHWNKRDSESDPNALDVVRLGRKQEFVRLGAKKRYSANKSDVMKVKNSALFKGEMGGKTSDTPQQIKRRPSRTGPPKLPVTSESPTSTIDKRAELDLPPPPPLETPILMKKNDSPVTLLKATKTKKSKLVEANSDLW